MSSPNASERAYHDLLAEVVGCIACRIDGIVNHYVSIHHIDGRTKRGAHMRVIPLCSEHHQTGGEAAPSIHPWKRRFEAKYGTQETLQAMCDAILEREGRV